MKKDNRNLLIIGVVLFTIAIIFFFVSSRFNKEDEIQSENVANNDNGNVTNELVIEDDSNNIDNYINKKFPNRSPNLNPVVEYSDIKVEDTSGSEITLDDYKGKATLILFCNPKDEDSIEELKILNRLYSSYSDKVEFMVVAKKSLQVNMDSAYNQNSIILPLFYEDGSASNAYDVTKYPTILIKLDTDDIVNKLEGLKEVDTIQSNLDILSGNFE
jgi:uncharacterized protein (UPF0333 family)